MAFAAAASPATLEGTFEPPLSRRLWLAKWVLALLQVFSADSDRPPSVRR